MSSLSVEAGSRPWSNNPLALLLLGVALCIVWVGGNLLFPGLAPTGIPSVLARVAIHSATLIGLWAALQRTDFSPGKRTTVWLAIAIPFTLWLIVIWTLAVGGAFQPAPGLRLPRLPIAIFLPLILALPLLLWSRALGAVLDVTPAAWLIALQVYRVFGGIFLVDWPNGKVAGAFAWPAGVGDMATGIMALPVALAVASGTTSGRRAGLWWNVFGLLDFAVAITMGNLTAPGPFQRFGFDIPASLAGTYPTVMIPAFSVPSSILLHALSLRQLTRRQIRSQM